MKNIFSTEYFQLFQVQKNLRVHVFVNMNGLPLYIVVVHVEDDVVALTDVVADAVEDENVNEVVVANNVVALEVDGIVVDTVVNVVIVVDNAGAVVVPVDRSDVVSVANKLEVVNNSAVSEVERVIDKMTE